MPTANGKNSRTRLARRVTALEGDPQNILLSKNSGGGKAARISAGGPVRGYVKLSDAAKAFGFDFRGKTVLDIGSSTGGFTKYALDHGATKVIAIEKGTNQMMEPLRHDPRVDLHEKTDIFDVGAQISAPDVIVADVSFVSLRKVLLHAKKALSDTHTDYLVMLKPQFEAQPEQLYKGVVKNGKIRREIIKHFELWLKSNGFVIKNKCDNTLKGKSGNTERFYYLLTIK